MAVNNVLERKNELLKRKISQLIMRQNRDGLGRQDTQFMQQFIRELHENNYNLKHS
jgi:hypothetical protein